MSNDSKSLAHDLTRALVVTLRPSRIAVMSLGLLIAVAAAVLFFWVGGFITGAYLTWLSWVIQRIGAVIFGCVVLASMSSAVAMAHAESSGQPASVPVGWSLVGRYVVPAFLGTIRLIILFVLAVVIIWVVGLVGRIKGVGPILWAAIFAPLVSLPLGLLAIFILVKLFFISFLFPAVLSVSKEKGVACYKQSWEFVKKHAAHVLSRLALTALICLVFYKVVLAGFGIIASQSSKSMGNNRVTLSGTVLFDWLAGVPGVVGTAPRALGIENPASPFRDIISPPSERQLIRLKLVAVAKAARPGTIAGGWVFSAALILLSVIPLSLPFLFFALSGYCTYLSLKDTPEIPLKTEPYPSEAKKTPEETAGKRRGAHSGKPAEGETA